MRKEKADLEVKAALEAKLKQDIEDQLGKLKKKVNAQDDMLSKESQLATLQSNLELQSKDLEKEKEQLEKRVASLEENKKSWQ